MLSSDSASSPARPREAARSREPSAASWGMEPSRPASPQYSTDPQEGWRYPRSRAARCRPHCAARSGTARPSARSAPAEPARRGPAPWRGAGWWRHCGWAGSWRGGAVPASLSRGSAAVGAALPAFPLRGALSSGERCSWRHAPPQSWVLCSSRYSSPVLLHQTGCEAVVNLMWRFNNAFCPTYIW